MTNYVSCSCNCQPRAVDWGKNGLICYGYSHSLAIYDPNHEETGKVLETLHQHNSQVKVVQWIETEANYPETEILSGSLDGSIIVWSRTADSWSPSVTLTLGDQLTTTHAAYLDQNPEKDDLRTKSLLICGSSFKEIFTIWHRTSVSDAGSADDKQTLDLKGKIPTEARITRLPASSAPMLVIVMDDASIYLFTWNRQKSSPAASTPNFQYSRHLTGHQDWIQCLDVILTGGSALLASGSQDGTIRLWKISASDAEKPQEDRINPFKVGDQGFEVVLESVLSGHEHWVYGVHWHPPVLVDGEWRRPNKLLSSALDKTMIIWEPNSAGIWEETVRLGRVGGNSLGFYSGKFDKMGTSVLAHGYQGTFHMWSYDEATKRWSPRSAPSGHFSDVNDLHWEAEGKYLISTSADQTTRVHVPWRSSVNSADSAETWVEVARPQIHGYDINCLTVLTSTLFASGADEKVVRIFEAPENFKKGLVSGEWRNPRSFGDRAAVPALGLTNKMMEDCDGGDEGDDGGGGEQRPPTEEEIIRYTLWPELEKLYGHGYEIFAIAARHDGKILATSCKSSSPEHSQIILWSTQTWSQVQKLPAHRLTVTQMEFSPNDRFLVSVSRDRRWALFRMLDAPDDTKIRYEVVLVSPAANALHSRIIWCCCWSPDSKYFATGSREGKIGVWRAEALLENANPQPAASLDLNGSSVTALGFCHQILNNNYVLAVGLEEGRIEIKKIIFKIDDGTFVDCLEFDTSTAHHKTVKRVAFRPRSREGIIQLASCSSDRAVKIYDIEISRIVNAKNS